MNKANIIPIKGQIRNEFRAPAIADMMVPTLDDLGKTKYNYYHKLVWVVSERSWFYIWRELPPDNEIPIGEHLNYWRRVTQNASIPEWKDGQIYFTGDCVFYVIPYEENPKKKLRIYMWIGLEPSYQITAYTKDDYTAIRKDDFHLTISNTRNGFGEGESIFINDKQYFVLSAVRVNQITFDVQVDDVLPETINKVGTGPTLQYAEPGKHDNWLCLSDDALGFRMEVTTPVFEVGQVDIISPMIHIMREVDPGSEQYEECKPAQRYTIDKGYQLIFMTEERTMTQAEFDSVVRLGGRKVYLMLK